MSQNWQTYPEITALLDPTTDDVMVRDVSNTSANATGTNGRLLLNAVLGLSGITPGGRLTTESGVPVSTSDRTAQGTIYYTPDAHDFVRLWDGTRPKLYQFTERSLAITATSGKNYDYFLYDNAGTLTLEPSAAWTNDTTRADALAWQAGIGWVKSGTPTRLWLGTIRASGTNTTEDSLAKRFVSNFYNADKLAMKSIDTTDTWSYSTATYRQANAAAGNQLSFVLCSPRRVTATAMAMGYGSAGDQALDIGVGVDSTSVPSGLSGAATTSATTRTQQMSAYYSGVLAAGYHYCAWLERGHGTGTQTWYGDAGTTNRLQAGITGDVPG